MLSNCCNVYICNNNYNNDEYALQLIVVLFVENQDMGGKGVIARM